MGIGRDRVSTQEIMGRHAAFAGRLQLRNFDDASFLWMDEPRDYEQTSRKTGVRENLALRRFGVVTYGKLVRLVYD